MKKSLAKQILNNKIIEIIIFGQDFNQNYEFIIMVVDWQLILSEHRFGRSFFNNKCFSVRYTSWIFICS